MVLLRSNGKVKKKSSNFNRATLMDLTIDLLNMSDSLHSLFLHCVLFTNFLEPNISRVFKQLGPIGLNDFKSAKEALASKKVGTNFFASFLRLNDY